MFSFQTYDRSLQVLCSKFHVKSLYAFGSAVTDAFSPSSDIDLLLDFGEDLSVEEYTSNYFLLHGELELLFQREIDLLTVRSLKNPYFIQQVDASKQLLYEA